MFTIVEKFRSLFSEVKRVLKDGVRYYVLEDKEEAYPSITSVISHVNRKKWADWQQKVGLQEANRVRNHSTRRGTKFHSVAEIYLQNGDYKSMEEMNDPLIQLMFAAARPHFDSRLSNIVCQEQMMASSKIGVAGTVDLICDVDGELSIVDFKTAKAEKPEEWLEDYFVQLSAYWAMFSERTGTPPKKLVVFLVGENGDVQIVERRNIMDYLETLQDYVDQFIQSRDAHSQRN
jgi:ATP-dependent exoDNAse (exonuclease V) beta subunit